MSAGPRLKIVGAGVALGLLVCAAAGGGSWAYLRFHGHYAAYVTDFDAYTSRHYPRLTAAIGSDAALRLEIETKRRIAFDHGGARLANWMFWKIVDSRLLAAAGDDAIRACHAAYTDSYRALAARPHLCRQMQDGDINGVDSGIGAAETMRATARCDAAMADGALHQDKPPPYLYGAAWRAATARAAAGPAALTPFEQEAVTHPESASDSAACSQGVKYFSNIDALPAGEGASLMRSDYAEANTAAIFDIVPPPSQPPPDSALQCAAPGTRFVLNNFLDNGRPNTWTSLGRHDFDCGVLSEAAGRHGAFDTLYEDLTRAPVPNPLRALWPLAVGKSVSVSFVPVDGEADEERLSVTGHARYWLPWTSVDAYSISREVWRGTDHYVIIRYWAPSLGFLIGRRSYAISGKLPDDGGQDFQLVAMMPPQ